MNLPFEKSRYQWPRRRMTWWLLTNASSIQNFHFSLILSLFSKKTHLKSQWFRCNFTLNFQLFRQTKQITTDHSMSHYEKISFWIIGRSQLFASCLEYKNDYFKDPSFILFVPFVLRIKITCNNKTKKVNKSTF